MTKPSDVKKWIRTRSIYDVTDLSEPDIKESVLVCMPKWVWYVARSLLFDYGSRLTSFYNERTVANYVVPNVAEWDEISDLISQGVGADIMCVQDIILALEGISAAITDKPCCPTGTESCTCGEGCGTGSGGSAKGEQSASEFEDDGIASFPAGYSDRTSYKSTKCNWAAHIIVLMKGDMDWFIGVSLVQLVATIMATALLTPIPFDDLIAIAASAILLFVSLALGSVATGIKTALTTQNQELICQLNDAVDVQTAKTNFLSILQPELTVVEFTFLNLMVNFDAFNKLFTHVDQPVTVGDCSSCGTCSCGAVAGFGSTSNGIDFVSEQTGSLHGVSVNVNSTGTDVCVDTCGPESVQVISNLVGWTPSSTTDYQVISYPVDCNTSENAWNQNSTWSGLVAGRIFQIWSNSPFTVTIDCQ